MVQFEANAFGVFVLRPQFKLHRYQNFLPSAFYDLPSSDLRFPHVSKAQRNFLHNPLS